MNNCLQNVNHKKIRVGENGRNAIFLNPSQETYTIGQIDGCLIDEGVRCDCFVSNSQNIALIEFKGCDVDHACQQIFATASHRSIKPHIANKDKLFLIVCSRFPRYNTDVQRYQSKAKQQYSANLRIVCNKVELKLE